MAVGDIYRVSLTTQDVTDPGNPFRNVFYYRLGVSPGPGVEADGVLSAFDNTILTPLADIVQLDTRFVLLEALNVSVPSASAQFATRVPTTETAGKVGGSKLPPFVSWGFRYNRATRATRNGYKRFSLVSEDSVSDGDPTSGTLLDIGVLEAALTGSISNIPATVEATPVIARIGPLGTVVVESDISSVQFYAVTTQNSRKR